MADFSQGWPSIDEATAKIRLAGGRYIFEVGPFDGRFITTTAIDTDDLYAQVEATPESCLEGGGYGLLFRFSDNGNYYLYNVYCNNTYTVIARVNGSLAPSALSHGPLPGSVRVSDAYPNTLGVLTTGDRFTLYLDNQVVASVSDDRHATGDLALYVVSEGANIVRVAFDNLEVWAVR